MEIKASDLRIMFERGKGFQVSFRLDSENQAAIEEYIRTNKDGYTRIQLTKWTEHRSLSANAYFHVLVNKIAEAMDLGEEETKKGLVLEYGTQMRNDDGSAVGIKLPEGTIPDRVGVKYAKWFDTRLEGGRTFNCYLVYEETHRYNQAQMNRLISGAVKEAKDLGIETLTPDELRRMIGAWQC